MSLILKKNYLISVASAALLLPSAWCIFFHTLLLQLIYVLNEVLWGRSQTLWHAKDLPPDQGLNPAPSAVRGQSLKQWATKDVPSKCLF